MTSLFVAVVAAGAAVWLVVWTLPWRPWSCRERLETPHRGSPESADLSDVTVLIPARNEADVIERALRGLARQGRGLRVVLVDDGSTDGTARVARQSLLLDLEVLRAGRPPPGWTGKLWALERGRRRVDRPLTLLLDADVELDSGVVPELRAKLRRRDLGMASLMAAPRMEGFWERLLMPAFVWFFKLLYPFSLARDPDSRVAAAAGGCALLETELFDRIGGLGSIRGHIIDDCALAREVKGTGARIWIGLTRSARSVRPRAGIDGIWETVSRTAYAQLRHSGALLAACSFLMIVAFWGPPLGLASGDPVATSLGAVGLGAMTLAYVPVLSYYGRSPAWALLLPLTATLYLAMTWTSAVRHWWGLGARWKGRRYGAATPVGSAARGFLSRKDVARESARDDSESAGPAGGEGG